MKLGPWHVSVPTEPGKYAKKTPALKYPQIVDIIADDKGTLLEYSKGQFWEMRDTHASWAKVEEL